MSGNPEADALICQVRSHGARIGAENGGLVLEADTPPPEELIADLRGHKPALLAALQCRDCGQQPIPPDRLYFCAECWDARRTWWTTPSPRTPIALTPKPVDRCPDCGNGGYRWSARWGDWVCARCWPQPTQPHPGLQLTGDERAIPPPARVCC